MHGLSNKETKLLEEQVNRLVQTKNWDKDLLAGATSVPKEIANE